MKGLIESAFDTGLVDEAVNRVTHSFKRRLNSPVHDAPSNNKQARFTSTTSILTHEREEPGDSDVVPRKAPNTTNRQHSPTSGFATSFQVNSPEAFQSELLASGTSVSFSGATNLSFGLDSQLQLDKVGTDSREQSIDNWFILDPDPAPLLSQPDGYTLDSDLEAGPTRQFESAAGENPTRGLLEP
jgi:hypothetical protein